MDIFMNFLTFCGTGCGAPCPGGWQDIFTPACFERCIMERKGLKGQRTQPSSKFPLWLEGSPFMEISG
ncbi:MAG: hypothetical protein LBQ51_06395 [Desulfovibrio sp.]|nr:hypothetical protein [Desulfovibrio sp.]